MEIQHNLPRGETEVHVGKDRFDEGGNLRSAYAVALVVRAYADSLEEALELARAEFAEGRGFLQVVAEGWNHVMVEGQDMLADLARDAAPKP